jgi:KDO2-lipid IV(A) lauroyltransferase
MLARSTALDRTLRNLDAGLIGLVLRATRHLSVEHASELGNRIGRAAGPRIRKHQHVLANLTIAFPDAPASWISETAVSIWGQIGRTMAEYPHLPRLSGPELGQRFELVNHLGASDLGPGRRGLVFAGAHQANWNLHATVGALTGLPLSVIYAEQANIALEQLIAPFRNAIPSRFVHVRDTVRHTMRELSAGRHVGLFVDHRIDQGELVPFFGQPAPTTTIAARIAAKLGTGIVPTRLERLPGVRFRLTLERPLWPEPNLSDPHDAAFEMTTRLNRRFEEWIRERPSEWCCAKRRWPKEILDPGVRGPLTC